MGKEHPVKIGDFEEFCWIRCEGKGSFLNSPAMKEFADKCIRQGSKCVVVDLENCAGMDSTFMGTMAGIANRISEYSGKVHVTGVDEKNRSALEDLGLDYLVEIEPADPVWSGLEDKARDLLIEKKAGMKSGTEMHSRHVLEAHEILSEANDGNREKFSGVVGMLSEQLKDSTKPAS